MFSDLSKPQNLLTNNLGGQGPGHGQEPHIFIKDVTTFRGMVVSLRIDNASDYRLASPDQTRYHYQMFQLNLCVRDACTSWDANLLLVRVPPC